jgi:uncharacterized protein (TIGR02246 family)
MRALVTRGPTIFSLVVLGALAVVAPAAAPPPGTASADEVAIGKMIDSLITALDDADVNKFTSLFAPDATLFFPLAGLPFRLEDRQQIATAFGAFFEAVKRERSAPPYMNLVPEGTRVQLLGDVAVVTFHFRGEDIISRRTVVLQKRSGAWLIVHLHASNLPVQKR